MIVTTVINDRRVPSSRCALHSLEAWWEILGEHNDRDFCWSVVLGICSFCILSFFSFGWDCVASAPAPIVGFIECFERERDPITVFSFPPTFFPLQLFLLSQNRFYPNYKFSQFLFWAWYHGNACIHAYTLTHINTLTVSLWHLSRYWTVTTFWEWQSHHRCPFSLLFIRSNF